MNGMGMNTEQEPPVTASLGISIEPVETVMRAVTELQESKSVSGSQSSMNMMMMEGDGTSAAAAAAGALVKPGQVVDVKVLAGKLMVCTTFVLCLLFLFVFGLSWFRMMLTRFQRVFFSSL
jgi:hypothetical protein